MGDINAFLDHGFSEPSVFAHEFFGSPDFTVATLRKILKTGVNASKQELAGEAWLRLRDGTLDPSTVLRYWAAQPRRWLSFKRGAPATMPEVGTPEALLTRFGEDGWHGPISDLSGSSWYIHTKRLFHYRITDNVQMRLSHVRWAVMAQVTQGFIALSWNNFTHRPEGKVEETYRYQFWQSIPDIFSSLESLLGGEKWKTPKLHSLVLHDLWDRYSNDQDFKWYHLKIRAERFGVALSARSAGITEINVQGLEALTKNLAQSAAKAAKITDDDTIERMESELLRTLLIEWGANSYSFQLDKREGAGEPQRTVFRGHCYFGLRKNLQTQDRFQHIECPLDTGGSTGALAFFIENL